MVENIQGSSVISHGGFVTSEDAERTETSFRNFSLGINKSLGSRELFQTEYMGERSFTFKAQVAMCRTKKSELLTNEDQVLSRWKSRNTILSNI
jgi:hypothetical protein